MTNLLHHKTNNIFNFKIKRRHYVSQKFHVLNTDNSHTSNLTNQERYLLKCLGKGNITKTKYGKEVFYTRIEDFQIVCANCRKKKKLILYVSKIKYIFWILPIKLKVVFFSKIKAYCLRGIECHSTWSL